MAEPVTRRLVDVPSDPQGALRGTVCPWRRSAPRMSSGPLTPPWPAISIASSPCSIPSLIGGGWNEGTCGGAMPLPDMDGKRPSRSSSNAGKWWLQV